MLVEYLIGDLTLKLEGTFIGYNTNKQNRRVYDCDDCVGEAVYPSFLHSDGYTDVDLWDYANPKSIDRGRDPRSVFREDQDRYTVVGVLWLSYLLDVGSGLEIGLKFKQIMDRDGRSTASGDPLALQDDYRGDISIGRLSFAYPITDTVKVRLGAQVDWWDEKNRDGSASMGYAYYQTTKVKPFHYGGASLRYYVEYLYKDQWRGERDPEQFWGVIRSKAALEVAW
jgi:hypothetical protein